MRMPTFLISLFITALVYTNATMATDETQPTDSNDTKLETISGTTTSARVADDQCPMHKGSKGYQEHHGDPCPYHDKDHHKAHQKCDHEPRKQ